MTNYERHTADHRLRKFSELSDYKLEDAEQDIRSLPVVSADGTELGLIDDLLIDEEAERVAAITLEDGRMVPVEPLEIRDRQVIDHGAGHRHRSDAKVYEARTIRAS